MTSVLRFAPALRFAVAQRPQVWRAGARRTFSARSTSFVKKYTEDHEWIELDSSGKIGTIGITEYAANALGDVVFVELPEKGLEVKPGDSIGAVESVKSASDIYAPIGGKVVETNPALEDKPAGINKDPEGNGWLAKLEISDPSQVETLMSKEAYDSFEK